jgi:hypothetical protein
MAAVSCARRRNNSPTSFFRLPLELFADRHGAGSGLSITTLFNWTFPPALVDVFGRFLRDWVNVLALSLTWSVVQRGVVSMEGHALHFLVS